MKKFNEYDEDTTTNWIGNQTPISLGVKVFGAILALSLVFGITGWVAGWFSTAGHVVGPQNVSKQYTQLEDEYQNLVATAGNVCSAQQLVDTSTNQDEKIQRRSQEQAYEQNYRRIAAEYDRRWANAFEARFVGPRHLPTTAPSLAVMLTQYCPAR